MLQLKTEKKLSDSEEGILWLKNVLEKFGSPHFRQFHDMLLLSIIEYIESDVRPWQSMWYQVLQEAHSRAFDLQVTALPHVPHGHMGVLGPGLVST